MSAIQRPSVLTLVALAWLVAACNGGATPALSASAPTPSATTASSEAASAAPSAAARAPLTVFGAASLKGALDQMKTAWESANPGSKLTISTDSSSALEIQIEQGATADVFVSADTTNPQKLVDKSLSDGTPTAFAGNVLTVIVPTTNPAGIQSPADLANSGVKVIAAGDEVPITKYATKAIANLAKLPGYPTDFAAKYASNVASKEDNVKAVVTKVELGEGDAGIVYVTDAKASSKVTPIAIPAEGNVPATYAGAVVRASAHVADARAFLDWVAGPDGQAILASFGFLPPPAG